MASICGEDRILHCPRQAPGAFAISRLCHAAAAAGPVTTGCSPILVRSAATIGSVWYSFQHRSRITGEATRPLRRVKRSQWEALGKPRNSCIRRKLWQQGSAVRTGSHGSRLQLWPKHTTSSGSSLLQQQTQPADCVLRHLRTGSTSVSEDPN